MKLFFATSNYVVKGTVKRILKAEASAGADL